jgi:hypothetical protein
MSLGMLEIVRRLGHHRVSPSTITIIEENRHRAIELALYYDGTLPDGFEKDRAIEAVQIANQWANSSVATRLDPTETALPEDLPPG